MDALAIVIMWISEGTKIREQQRREQLKKFCMRHRMIILFKSFCQKRIEDFFFPHNDEEDYFELNEWYYEYIFNNPIELVEPIWNYNDGFA